MAERKIYNIDLERIEDEYVRKLIDRWLGQQEQSEKLPPIQIPEPTSKLVKIIINNGDPDRSCTVLEGPFRRPCLTQKGLLEEKKRANKEFKLRIE